MKSMSKQSYVGEKRKSLSNVMLQMHRIVLRRRCLGQRLSKPSCIEKSSLLKQNAIKRNEAMERKQDLVCIGNR